MAKTPTRFPKGVTNAAPDSALYKFGLPDPTSWLVFFDDFFQYQASNWVVSTTEGGAGSASEVLQDEDGGILRITNDNADNDSDYLQWSGGKTSVTEFIRIEAGRQLMFKARFRIDDPSLASWVIGVQERDTSPLTNADGIYFKGTDENIGVFLRGGSTEQEITVGALEDDVYTELAFYYDGKKDVEVYINDAFVALGDATAVLAAEEEKTISFGLQNNSAAARRMDVDYILMAKER